MKYFLIIITLVLFFQIKLDAQFESLRNKLEEKVEQQIEKGLEEPAKEEKKEEEVKNNEESPKTEIVKSNDLQSYSKFDFIPGETMIYYDDFSQDEIGAFPLNWWTNGSGEIVTLNNHPGNWFKIVPSGAFIPTAIKSLPENYTVEFDAIFQDLTCIRWDFINTNAEDNDKDGIVPNIGGVGTNFNFTNIGAFQFREGGYGEVNFSKDSKFLENIKGEKLHISISIQKQRYRLYVNQNKVCDLPTFVYPDLKMNRFRFLLWGCDESVTTVYISNLKFAIGKPDLRSKFITEGKFVTNAITFDVGSDKIKPESYAVLKEMAEILKQNATVKVKIIGHTDSDGDAAKNLDLSKKRASSVKNELSKTFGIDPSRMEYDGKGASVSLVPNTDPVNKAKNRRVEFVKM